MTYTLHIQKGTITRDSDQVVVAPTSDDQSSDYLAYRAWAEAGNEPTIIDDPNYDPNDELPIEVDAFQLREALNQLGLRSTIESLVAQGSQTLKDMWEYKTAYHSDHPEVAAMGSAIGKTAAEVRQIFELARTIS